MAHVPTRTPGEARRYPSSTAGVNRYENRPPTNSVMCRNGPQCRKYQEGTCHYNHEFGSLPPNGANLSVARKRALVQHELSRDRAKKSLNVDSPAFTPKIGNVQPIKSMAFSPKAAVAAAFTPRGSGTTTPALNSHSKEPSLEFVPQQATSQATPQFQEFVPGQTFMSSQQPEIQPHLQTQVNPYGDAFQGSQASISGLDASQAHLNNPYAQSSQAVSSQPFYQDASSYKYPLNYHLYASIGPRRENLLPYQRSTADFFMPDDLREDLQKKSEATLQTFANSTLPQAVEHYHSLVALDTNNQKGPSTFGLPSWIYKAVSARDGNTYALRRIEGFRLSDGAAISKTINTWKRIGNASAVRVHEAFTGRWFGDSSLVVVTDYFPRSQTLAEKHFPLNRHPGRVAAQGSVVPESELWGYIVQLAGALKAIHEAGAAAQTVIPSKVILTSKNRVRLSGCGVLDILTYEQQRPVQELQRHDLQSLGRLVLDIAARGSAAHQNAQKALEIVSKSYSDRLRACLAWLVTPPPLESNATEAPEMVTQYNVHALLNNIADKVVLQLDSALHYEDDVTTSYMRELENGRLVRLLAKLNVILERPDTSSTPIATTNVALLNQPSAAWSETGERYYLKLFRDYVFHQVDHEGRPVLDLGHIVTCLNKLDAGIDEKLQLISRDEQSMFIVSYKEVKRGFEAAWAEISKASNPGRR